MRTGTGRSPFGAQCWSFVLAAVLGGCGQHGEREISDLLDVTWDTLAVIGALDGLDHEVFGQLIQLEGHEDHGLFLLDLQRRSVFWYGLDGRFRASLDRLGEGPGELSTPRNLYLDRDGSLWVVDPGNARVSRFVAQGEDSLPYLGSVPSTFPGGGICRLGDRPFWAGLRGGHVLHEVDATGVLVRRIGPAPPTPGLEEFGDHRVLIRRQLLQGSVFCAADFGLLVIAFSSYPSVRAYEPHGVATWELELEGIESVGWQVLPGGALQGWIDPERGAHFLRSMVSWDDETLLLQYEIRFSGDPPEGQEFHGLDSRLIALATGEELARSTTLPWIGARLGNQLVLVENVPFPRAVVVRLKRENNG